VRSSFARSVPGEWIDPMRTTSPNAGAINSTRRRMKRAVRLDLAQQVLAVDFDHSARCCHTNLNEPAPSGQHVHFACEHARRIDRHQVFARIQWTDKFDLSLDKDDEPRGLVAGLYQDLALLNQTPPAMRRDAGDLVRRGHGKHRADAARSSDDCWDSPAHVDAKSECAILRASAWSRSCRFAIGAYKNVGNEVNKS
jgi:hypothetical protein